MIKIWAKTAKGEKLTASEIFTFPGNYSEETFSFYLREICEDMDIPTPIALTSHTRGFTQFNVVRFKSDDFVERVDFDALILENAADK